MRILIAGWQGQVAQALVEVALARDEVKACAVGRPALDICEARTIERALGDNRPDVLINTAGYTAVDKAEEEAERAFALNCEGARLLAVAAERRGVPIIHLSTDYVFDGRKASAYVEADPTGPATVYGRSKLAGEAEVVAANPRHVILRTAWVHSPFGQNFVKTMLRKAREGGRVRVVADQHGSPTYALHLATAIIDVAKEVTRPDRDERAAWGIYHAAGSGSATWYDMARAIFDAGRAAGLGEVDLEAIRTADYPTKTPRPLQSELDCTKLAQTFGIRLPDWREGVAACVGRLMAS